MPEQGTRLDPRLAVRIHVRVVHEVARHQVDGALNAFEVSTDRTRERAQDGRLANTDIALEQHMSAREHGHVEQPNGRRLSDDRRPDLRLDPERPLAPILQLLLGRHLNHAAGSG